jgi:hypothetical protein
MEYANDTSVYRKLDFNISKKTYGTNRTCLTFRNNRVLQWVLVVAHCSVFSLVCFGLLCVFLSLFHWALSAFLFTALDRFGKLNSNVCIYRHKVMEYANDTSVYRKCNCCIPHTNKVSCPLFSVHMTFAK